MPSPLDPARAALPDDGLPSGWDPRDVPDGDGPDAPEDERIGRRDLGEWRSLPGKALARSVTKVAKAQDAAARRGFSLLVLLVTAGVGAALTWLFGWMSGELYEEVEHDSGIAAFDQPLLEAAARARTPESARLVTHFTDLGGPVIMPFVALALVALLVWLRRSWSPAILMVVAVAGSLLTTIAGKRVIGRARPPHELAVPPYELSASFPSGHTLNATVIIGVAAYLLLIHARTTAARVTTVVVAAVLVLAMGLSRVYLGHHWLTDVIAGWALGLFWLAVVITAHRLLITVRRRVPSAA